MIRIGECIRYGQSGICKIREILPRDFAGEVRDYYVLEPLYRNGSVVYVPCDNADLIHKMLPPLTEDEIEEAFHRVEAMPSEWIRDFRRRSETAKRALSSDDRADALFLIKNIYAHKKDSVGDGKRIHTTDDYFLKDAENLIACEIAYVCSIPFEEALARIRARLG